MDEAALLAELRVLADNVPDFSSYAPTSRIHQEWLGKVHALVEQWNRFEATPLRAQINTIGFDLIRDTGVAGVVAILHRAIADLEFRLPAAKNQAFGPGAVYDFFKALRDLLASATQSVMIVDPYMDEQVLDPFVTATAPHVEVRLLVHKGGALTAALPRFVAQTKRAVHARSSPALHDRVVFLDDHSCWVLGQSIKDAAKSKPTYLAPLDGATAKAKRTAYEQIWATATPL